MPSELERDINDIKISVARIEERLKIFESHVTTSQEHDKRLRVLEEYKAKLLGMCAGIGALAGTVAAIIIKLI
jgi:hypothetical protein